MFARFLPQEENFFELYAELSERVVEGANELRALLRNLHESEARAIRVKDVEHAGDEITHKTIARLRTTFITPLDRDDMHRLVSEMDNVLDSIDATAQRVFMYDVRELPDEIHQLADIGVETTEHVRQAVKGLANLKDPDRIIATCVEINRLENAADKVFRTGLGKLFRDEKDAIALIKVKEIFELMEGTTDYCEQVANLIDRIVLGHV